MEDKTFFYAMTENETTQWFGQEEAGADSFRRTLMEKVSDEAWLAGCLRWEIYDARETRVADGAIA